MPFACSSRQHAISSLFILQPARLDFIDEKVNNQMKSFGEKLIKVANVSHLSYCKLNSAVLMSKRGDLYWVVHGPDPGGGPWIGGQ